MRKQGGNKVKLGIFVSIGILFLIAGVYFIGKKQQLFNDTFTISGIFKDISGLQVGDNVRLCGINIGVISDIAIVTDTTVKVDLTIDQNAKKFIKKDARATIGSDGLMGNKIVIIMAGTSGKEEIRNNDLITTSPQITMDDILVKLKVTSTNAADITDDLAVIMNNIRDGKGTVGKLFMDTVFAKDIDQSLVNIKQGTKGFKQNMDAAGHNVLLRGFFRRKEREKEKEKNEGKEEVNGKERRNRNKK